MNKILKIEELKVTRLKDIINKSLNSKSTFKRQDINGRKIELYKIVEAELGGSNLYYPNVLIKSYHDDTIINPYQERIMSLSNAIKINTENIEFKKEITCKINSPVYFFIYNSDNYYHFLYDTLPYLILFMELKKKIPNLKLLVNYSNPGRITFYRFFLEFLELLGIDSKHILIANLQIYLCLIITNPWNRFKYRTKKRSI